MDSDVIIQIVEDYHLTVTIKPDGRVSGLPHDLERLKVLYYKATKDAEEASKRPCP